jgi:CRP/FNR family cyclic AMP-dependent transcriptional regulator
MMELINTLHEPQPRCLAAEGLLQGALCRQLANRPARCIPSGQFLYLTGQRAGSLYLLKSGLIKMSRVSPGGEEIILQLFRPGELLGELCFCTRERREQAVALERSEVVEITLEDLRAQLQRTPGAAFDLVETLCSRLSDAYSRFESLSFESALARLVRTLLLLAETLGEVTPDGVHISHYIRQEELAQMIAARREVVSSLLNRLREQGLIDYPRKGQISVRRDALQAHLGSLIQDEE